MVVPLKDKVILGTLSSHYQDDVLSQMLIAAKKKPETKEMATTLQIEQLQTWLSKKTPADDVFALLQLNKADDKLFDSPQFALWSKYLDDLSGPNKETTMIATLSTHYADEAMIKLINAAKDNPAMKGMATKLEGAQHKKWIAAGTSPVDVFKFYQLDRAGDSLFTSPQFDTWVTYLKRFNAANPKKEPTSQFGTFRKVYGDEDLAKILIKAQGVDKTKDIATKLQEEQIIYWLKSKQKVRDVQKWLGVDKNTASALETAAYKKYEGIYLDQPLVRNGRK
ncbi:Avirulence (Avh) protein [Phytophthora megakarya]|uniref:Avirulence (Avh) protein n=1 Tax=Phytophthora megakarya TaxID=4795 RepID=A0A225W3D8_9STRA|nr:Avirulence (Avh) protein [Phytophthora megakarya]